MGSDKAVLGIGGGASMIERADRALSAVAREILLATSRPEPYQFLGRRNVPDAVGEDRGPLAGIVAGLEALAANEVVLVVACDLPFVSEAALRRVADELLAHPEADAAVPHTPDGDQPLCAAYRPRAARPLREALECGRLSVVEALGRIAVHRVAAEAEAYLNVNDRSELARAERRAS